jgi:ribose/xylose/arabinose/galactoside ABC-type transport system permease subunit
LTEGYTQIIGGYVVGRLAVPTVIFVFLILLAIFVLNYTRFGRHIYAVGDNEISARASGLRIERIKLIAYVICGAMAGLAGMVLSARVEAASPIAGTGAELDAIAAVVIGGTSLSGGVGGIGGTVIGALIIGVISNGLDIINVSAYFQQIVKGLIIALAVLIDRK